MPAPVTKLNLAANPHVVLTTGANRWTDGVLVTVEGEATPVSDDEALRQLAALWSEKWDGRWRYEVGDGCFEHPGQPDRVLVFAVTPRKVLAFAQGHFGHTTHRFPRPLEAPAAPAAAAPRPAAP